MLRITKRSTQNIQIKAIRIDHMQITGNRLAILLLITCLNNAHFFGMSLKAIDLLNAAQRGDLEHVPRCAFGITNNDLLEAIEIAVINNDLPMIQSLLTKKIKLPVNTCLSRIQGPIANPENAASFTILETALITHDEKNGNNKLPIIELLLAHGARRTPTAKIIAALPGKEIIKPLICG